MLPLTVCLLLDIHFTILLMRMAKRWSLKFPLISSGPSVSVSQIPIPLHFVISPFLTLTRSVWSGVFVGLRFLGDSP
ncbi:hypothetical protein [Human papillomavirus type 41]|uniref:ORF Z protein n=1 Tax=Human papillomavirus type 41 TaxID=10589 RepID=Q84214_HPV41|nr:hypothetical protein [Human papillomavirus type 41]CAA39622.1 ORF Z [Human papillomavirus type 41]